MHELLLHIFMIDEEMHKYVYGNKVKIPDTCTIYYKTLYIFIYVPKIEMSS